MQASLHLVTLRVPNLSPYQLWVAGSGGVVVGHLHSMPSLLPPWRSAGKPSRSSILCGKVRRQISPFPFDDERSVCLGNARSLLFRFRSHAIFSFRRRIDRSRIFECPSVALSTHARVVPAYHPLGRTATYVSASGHTRVTYY